MAVTNLEEQSSASPSEERLLASMGKNWHVCERYERLNVPCPFRLAQMEEDDPDEEPRTPIPRGDRQPSRPRKPTLRLPHMVAIPAKGSSSRGGGGTGPRRIHAKVPEQHQVPVRVPRFPPVFVPTPATATTDGPKQQPIRTPIQTMPDGVPGIDPAGAIDPARGLSPTTQGVQPTPGAIPGLSGTPNLGGEPFLFQPRAYNQLFNTKPAFSLPPLTAPEPLKSARGLTPRRIALMELWVTAAGLAEEIYAPHYAKAMELSNTTGRPPVTNTSAAGTEFDQPRRGVTVQEVGRAAGAAGAIGTGAAALWRMMRPTGGGGGGFQFPSMPGDPGEGLFKAP